MKGRKLYIVYLMAFILPACQKNLDYFVPDPGQYNAADSTWYNSINNTMPVFSLKNQLLLDMQKDSLFLTGSPATVTTNAGLQCTIDSNSLVNASNQSVSGEIYLASYLLKKKGDMIRMGTPTTSNGRMLVSGGELFLRLSNNSSELTLRQGAAIQLQYNDSPISQMAVFNGDQSDPSAFNWLPNPDSINQVTTLNQSYQLLTTNFQWINCDHFYDTAGLAQTKLAAILPSNYTNANSIAYTVFSDLRSVIGMYGNANSRQFSTNPLPAGQQVAVVIISKQGNDYYLGHTNAVTTLGSATTNTQQISVTPVKTSLSAIIAYLDNL